MPPRFSKSDPLGEPCLYSDAMISTSTVNIAQQLCGSQYSLAQQFNPDANFLTLVNVLAYYSGTVFSNAGADRPLAMGFSMAFGKQTYTLLPQEKLTKFTKGSSISCSASRPSKQLILSAEGNGCSVPYH